MFHMWLFVAFYILQHRVNGKCAWKDGANDFYLTCAIGRTVSAYDRQNNGEFTMSICKDDESCFIYDQHKSIFGVATWTDSVGDCDVLGAFDDSVQPTYSAKNNGTWTFKYFYEGSEFKPIFQCDPSMELKM